MKPNVKSKFERLAFSCFIFLNISGVILGCLGIAKMKREGMPPFNDGIYTTVWHYQPPPEEVIAWSNSMMGWLLLIALPIIFWLATFQLKWRVVGQGGNSIWAMIVFSFGIWMWIHGQFQ